MRSNNNPKDFSDKAALQGVFVGALSGALMMGGVSMVESFGKAVFSGVKEYVVEEEATATATAAVSTKPSVCIMPLDEPLPTCGK